MLTLCGAAIHVIVLPWVPIVLISTASGSAIIVSTLLSVRFLGEKLVWKSDIPAFLLIILGGGTIIYLSTK